MYYTIYKITNQINGKIYIGAHKTKNLNDNYMGSGKYLKRAIEKHGVQNFTKEILFVFDNPGEMYAKEAELVTEDFLAEENTYNLKVGGFGGFGGFDYINENKLNSYSIDPNLAKKGRVAADKALEEKYGSEWRQVLIDSARTPEVIRKRRETYLKNGNRPVTKQLNSVDAIAKKKETYKRIEHQRGSKNSQFGTMWIMNSESGESKKIKKDDLIPDGWVKGRKIKNRV